jgi:type VI secretion system secreted protein Hcp
MALEIFLKLGTIKGDSTDARHRDEIRVLSWDWGLESQPGQIGGSGGGGAGRTTFRRLRFAHLLDVATPPIMQACASGRHIDRAALTVRKPGATPFEFLTIALSNVQLVSVDTAVNEEHGDTYETVTLVFTKIEFRYFPQSPTGGPGSPVDFVWDLNAGGPA